MRGVDFDQLLACAPVDLIAQIVTSPSTEARCAGSSKAVYTFQLCPPVTHWPEDVTESESDLTGNRIGDLLVQGYLDAHKKDYWVVRCSCGRFEIRRGKSLRRAMMSTPTPNTWLSYFCHECAYVFDLSKKAQHQAVGLTSAPRGKTAAAAPKVIRRPAKSSV